MTQNCHCDFGEQGDGDDQGLRTPNEEIAFTARPKFTPTPKFLGTAEAYFVCHIGPNFQISLIYVFIGCL